MTKKKVMRSPRVPSPLNRLHSTPVAALLLGSDRNDRSRSETAFERPASRYITVYNTCNQIAILCKVAKDKCGCCKAAGISRLKHACGAGHKRCPKINSQHPADPSHPLHVLGLAQVRRQQLPRCFCKATLDCVAHTLYQKVMCLAGCHST